MRVHNWLMYQFNTTLFLKDYFGHSCYIESSCRTVVLQSSKVGIWVLNTLYNLKMEALPFRSYMNSSVDIILMLYWLYG